ncbi:sugar phosphate isomerase/epimerase family protein [Roseimaritima sediminicola]|uniref:sugar phosphate isomerase/epimerase family protein n=1 Tax=Roseimaritima sediminicola TaxID=2662066 RepID=UPI00129843A0|nr:sugar phosphate isomerase/epimerase family protein [Roseimaritima sediminicola]
MLRPDRRTFLSLSAAMAFSPRSSLSAASPAEVFWPQAAVSAYSLRSHFAWSRGRAQEPREPGIDLQGFIDFCAAHRAAAELTAYFFPPDVRDDQLLQLRRYAFRRGVPICGTAIGNRFDEYRGDELEQDVAAALRWIERTALLGASHIRLFAGRAKTLADPQRFEASVAAVRRCAQHAGERGVVIGLENHGGITAETLLRFLDAVDSPWVGINLDTGNFPTDPYTQLRQCADRAVHVQWKVAIRNEQGQHEDADFQRLADILREVNYAGYVAMEYEAGGDARQETAAALERMKAALGIGG